MPEEVDLIVIGSGQGGVPLARDYARAGKHVVLFERGKLGGSCVNVGCTPSKAFLAAAHNAGRARRAAPLGIDVSVDVDVAAVMTRVRKIRDEWHDSAEKHVAETGIDLVRAQAAFTGERTVAGGGRSVRAPHVVIDAGTSPQIPPIPGLAGTPYRTNLDWFEQPLLPKTLAVIGGGYIGLELGQGSCRLGSEVTVLEPSPHLMTREEPDAVDVVRASLERDGVRVRLSTRVTSAAYDGAAFSLDLSDGTTLRVDGVLVAAGRVPNTHDLGALKSGIELDERGYVRTDATLQTACAGVYALGDVAGQPAFTHVSWEDYRRLSATLSGKPRTRDDRVLSYCTFTEPQLARTGMSEREARDAGIDCDARTLQLADTARGEEWNVPEGFFRIVIDRRTDKIIGATLVGYEAGELVHAIAFGIELGATWRDLDAFVGIHPTFGESLPSVARMFE